MGRVVEERPNGWTTGELLLYFFRVFQTPKQEVTPTSVLLWSWMLVLHTEGIIPIGGSSASSLLLPTHIQQWSHCVATEGTMVSPAFCTDTACYGLSVSYPHGLTFLNTWFLAIDTVLEAIRAFWMWCLAS